MFPPKVIAMKMRTLEMKQVGQDLIHIMVTYRLGAKCHSRLRLVVYIFNAFSAAKILMTAWVAVCCHVTEVFLVLHGSQ